MFSNDTEQILNQLPVPTVQWFHDAKKAERFQERMFEREYLRSQREEAKMQMCIKKNLKKGMYMEAKVTAKQAVCLRRYLAILADIKAELVAIRTIQHNGMLVPKRAGIMDTDMGYSSALATRIRLRQLAQKLPRYFQPQLFQLLLMLQGPAMVEDASDYEPQQYDLASFVEQLKNNYLTEEDTEEEEEELLMHIVPEPPFYPPPQPPDADDDDELMRRLAALRS
mmetsp:Transcript_5353/g.7515  ORF Transcript_5353/g.7515 Transcript_5353/m.7515 type:complete len:225 (-) Transcript_5353:403-1077(-)